MSSSPNPTVIKALFCRRPSDELSEDQIDRGCLQPDIVEEMYEEGSPMLAQRLNISYPAGNMFRLHNCAVCQLEMKPGEGISVHGTMPKHLRVDPMVVLFSAHPSSEKVACYHGS